MSEADEASTPDHARDEMRRAAAGMRTAIGELRDLLEQPMDTPAGHARRLEEALLAASPSSTPDRGVSTEWTRSLRPFGDTSGR